MPTATNSVETGQRRHIQTEQAPTIAHMQVLGALSKKELLIQQPFGLSSDSADFIIQMCVIKLARFRCLLLPMLC